MPSSRAGITIGLSALAVLAMLAVVIGVDPRFPVAGDGHYVYAAARSLAFDGDLDLTNQYRVMGDRWGLGRDPSQDGWRLPPRELGPSLLMVPGLWLHHLGHFDPRWEPAFAALLPAASLGPCWLACVRIVDRVLAGSSASASPAPRDRDRARAAEGLGAAAVLAFVVPFYAAGRGAYPHAADALACAWLLLALVEERRPMVVGLCLAAAVTVRLQNLLWLAWLLPGLWAWARSTPKERAASSRPLAALQIAGLASLALVPPLWLALAHPGSQRGPIRWGLDFFDLHDLPLDLLRVLGGVHGLVRWTPVAAVAIAALVVAAARAEAPARARSRRALLVLAALTLLFACVRDVDGGEAFGARRFAGISGLLALGLGQGWLLLRGQGFAPARAKAVAFAALLCVLTALNLARSARATTGALSLKAVSSAEAPGSPPTAGGSPDTPARLR